MSNPKCDECDQLMLKKGQRRKDPDDYRHARGCPRASKRERTLAESYWQDQDDRTAILPTAEEIREA